MCGLLAADTYAPFFYQEQGAARPLGFQAARFNHDNRQLA